MFQTSKDLGAGFACVSGLRYLLQRLLPKKNWETQPSHSVIPFWDHCEHSQGHGLWGQIVGITRKNDRVCCRGGPTPCLNTHCLNTLPFFGLPLSVLPRPGRPLVGCPLGLRASCAIERQGPVVAAEEGLGHFTSAFSWQNGGGSQSMGSHFGW